ncbi:hypothetical protein DL96DRAFT_1628751 [Flagelloscypha sp. PMI_526]|nr:hypothetical protein DL96DRAFT_1628751 [Flagelloscypha sp. PMI_526]
MSASSLPHPQFPLELFIYVLDYLSDHKRAMRACCLVSRSFSRVCQARLFRRVVFAYREGKGGKSQKGLSGPEIIRRFHLAVKENPHLRPFVQEIRIAGSALLARSIHSIIELLPHVVRMELNAQPSDSGWILWNSLSPSFRRALMEDVFPNLRSLELRHIQSLPDMLRFPFPALEHLLVENISINASLREGEDQPRLTTRLQTLSIRGDYSGQLTSLMPIASKNVSTLRVLDVGFTQWAIPLTQYNIMQFQGHPLLNSPTIFKFEKFPSLQTFKAAICFPLFDPYLPAGNSAMQSLSQELEKVTKSICLEEIEFTVTYTNNPLGPPDASGSLLVPAPWTSLDERLQSEYLEKFKAVSFILPLESGEDDVEEFSRAFMRALPKTWSKGWLAVKVGSSR